jgi:hypothetical protein
MGRVYYVFYCPEQWPHPLSLNRVQMPPKRPSIGRYTRAARMKRARRRRNNGTQGDREQRREQDLGRGRDGERRRKGQGEMREKRRERGQTAKGTREKDGSVWATQTRAAPGTRLITYKTFQTCARFASFNILWPATYHICVTEILPIFALTWYSYRQRPHERHLIVKHHISGNVVVNFDK